MHYRRFITKYFFRQKIEINQDTKINKPTSLQLFSNIKRAEHSSDFSAEAWYEKEVAKEEFYE
jgi:hypothetical protein